MSSLTQQQMQALIDYQAQLKILGWRGVVHIQTSKNDALARSQEIVAVLAIRDVLYANQSVQALQKRLGTEVDALVINAYQGVNPNVLGMTSACLKAGGLLIVISASCAAWRNTTDADYLRMLSHKDELSRVKGLFLNRLINALEFNPLWLRYVDGEFYLPQLPSCEKAFALDLAEQEKAIEAIQKVATGHARRPLVLSADRGRGKSSALGLACAQLMQNQPIKIVVSSIGSASLNTLFLQLAKALNQPIGATHYQYQNSDIRFVAIDDLLHGEHDAQLVIIDEAAAIPVNLLKLCIERFNRLVFSTTLNGYEGNGRGFELRFLPHLLKSFPQTRRFELRHPLRWRIDDPLEASINQLLLLQHATEILPPFSESCHFAEIARDELVANEALLSKVFSLLVLAHYQTSPDDLRLMLDHPDLRIFALTQQGAIAAVALIMQEGNFPAEIEKDLAKGRRCRGHLLPQALLGDGIESRGLCFWRVLRIVVQPEWQGQGLGKTLLGEVEKVLEGDVIGASFSLESDVLGFWQSAGFELSRIGSHKESSTGQYAAIVLKALSDQGQHLLDSARFSFYRQLPYLLLTQNSELDASALLHVADKLPFQCDALQLSQVEAYTKQHRSYEQVSASLQAWCLQEFSNAASNTFNEWDGLLAEKVLVNRHWKSLSDRYKLYGRTAIEKALRERISQRLDRIQ